MDAKYQKSLEGYVENAPVIRHTIDIVEFAEDICHIELLEYQKMFLRRLMKGEYIRTPRQVGRTTCINIAKKYLDYIDTINKLL